MATTGFSLGSIYGDITDGGGAAAVTVDVFNAMWRNAQAKATAGMENVDKAIALADPAPQILPVTLDKSYLPPAPPILPNEDPLNGQALYDAKRAELETMVTGQYRSYITEFFPDPTYFEHALGWCDRAIVDGGSGVNSAVEQALFQRDRARILADSDRVSDELTANFANRRFPLPPGALVGALLQVSLDAGRKLAESSRTVMIESWKAELENVRFAIKTVLDLRQSTLNSAGEYIRILLQGPQVAADLASKLASIRSEVSRNMVQLYSATVSALDPKVRLSIADANLQMEGLKANQAALSASIDAKVKAALAGAQMVATQSAAGINAINASSGISGSDSSSV